MRKGKKIIIFAAVILVAVGILTAVCAMVMMNFDFGKMNTMSYVTKTYIVHEDFEDIFIDDTEADVKILPSDDGQCKVVCTEDENDTICHEVSVSKGKLKIELNDNRSWRGYIGVFLESMEVLIYLPDRAYESIEVKTSGGSMDIPDGFSFKNVKIESSSGDISMCADVGNSLIAESSSGKIDVNKTSPETANIRTSSGDVTVENVKGSSALTMKTVSGHIEVSDTVIDELTAHTSSGEMDFVNVIANEEINAESTSGDVCFDGCDSASIFVTTSSGFVKGTLLSEKVFTTHTSSGDIDVPHSQSGGKCEISTSSGDIQFK